MDDNTLILNNYSDKTFDFKNLITKKESIILQKCNRIEIVISKAKNIKQSFKDDFISMKLISNIQQSKIRSIRQVLMC